MPPCPPTPLALSSLTFTIGWGSVGRSRAMGGFASHRQGFPLKGIDLSVVDRFGELWVRWGREP